MENVFIEIWCAVVGLCIGSFLTVCIYRVPLSIDLEDDVENAEEDAPASDAPAAAEPPATSDSGPPGDRTSANRGSPISFTHPRRSCCPHCHTQIKAIHNIPVLSWLMLGGKCAYCGARIPARYPLVELATAIMAVGSYQLFDLTLTAAMFFLFGCSLIVISVIDYDFYIIPNVISYPGMALGLALGGLNQYLHFLQPPFAQDFLTSFLGFMLGGGFLWAVAEIYFRVRKIEGLGFGDVKLLGMTGAFFGPVCAMYTIFVGSLIGSVFGITLMIVQGRKMTHEIPFGPYLAAGTMYYLLAEALATRFDIMILPVLSRGF